MSDISMSMYTRQESDGWYVVMEWSEACDKPSLSTGPFLSQREAEEKKNNMARAILDLPDPPEMSERYVGKLN